MIDDTINKITARLESANTLSSEQKDELRKLLTALKMEIDALSQTDTDHAQSIAGFTDISTHEAIRDSRKPQLLKSAIQGLSSSIEGFEKEHPGLVEVVNRISVMLSNLGI
jgi:ABC-type transporter Mla subunit MlaD